MTNLIVYGCPSTGKTYLQKALSKLPNSNQIIDTDQILVKLGVNQSTWKLDPLKRSYYQKLENLAAQTAISAYHGGALVFTNLVCPQIRKLFHFTFSRSRSDLIKRFEGKPGYDWVKDYQPLMEPGAYNVTLADDEYIMDALGLPFWRSILND